jgi:hypothetical protein
MESLSQSVARLKGSRIARAVVLATLFYSLLFEVYLGGRVLTSYPCYGLRDMFIRDVPFFSIGIVILMISITLVASLIIYAKLWWRTSWAM